MIIDCHCHANTEKLYKQYKEKANCDKTICIRAIKKLINNVDVDKNEEEFYELLSNHNNLYGVECIDYDEDIEFQLSRIKSRLKNYKKIIGLKLYPGYQYFYPTDKKLFPVYKFACENKLVMIFHQGDVWDPANTAQVKYTHPVYIDEISTYFPEVNFVISHFAFPYILETAMIVNKNNNIYTDISGCMAGGTPSEYFIIDIKRALSYFPSIINKIMHGTDFCGNHTLLNNTIDYEMFVKNNFTMEETNKILYKNAETLYRI